MSIIYGAVLNNFYSGKSHQGGQRIFALRLLLSILFILAAPVKGWLALAPSRNRAIVPVWTPTSRSADFILPSSISHIYYSSLGCQNSKMKSKSSANEAGPMPSAPNSYSSASNNKLKPREGVIDLQTHTHRKSPADVLSHLSNACQELGIESYDYYGDFQADSASSYLRKFESELAHHFGKEDAVFCVSGGMAQSIALMIHSETNKTNIEKLGDYCPSFACHPTSHVTLHENNAYSELLKMEAMILGLEGSENYDPERLKIKGCFGMEPLRLSQVQKMFHAYDERENPDSSSEKFMLSYPNKVPLGKTHVSTIMLELPHREIGGKLTPWEEVEGISCLCQDRGVRFHCDGARIFEASVGYGHETLQQTARPFDTIYISFYKGLGALSGAMLLGDTEFCTKARVWMRRMGGNLYTLLPYAVSSWNGFRKNCLSPVTDCDISVGDDGNISYERKWKFDRKSFERRRQKLCNIMKMLKRDGNIGSSVSFDPVTPQTNIVHGYLQISLEQCMEVIDKVETKTGIRILNRVRSCSDESKNGGNCSAFQCRFEWTVGEANVLIDDAQYFLGWQEFSKVIAQMKGNE
mmetsp:Transcript_33/g.74  ORF Transcript_33/g.74 Transcript_33/m.74 type:complete len:581 (+) Transcript_33:136-1878(+)